jgi:hypothetical protein
MTELTTSQADNGSLLAAGKSCCKSGGIGCCKPTHNAGPFFATSLLQLLAKLIISEVIIFAYFFRLH